MRLRNIILAIIALSVSISFFPAEGKTAVETAIEEKEEFISSKYLAVVHAINSRDYKSVAKFLNQALNIAPNDKVLKKRAVLPFVHAGDVEKAISLVKESEDLSANIKMLLLVDKVQKGDYKTAEEVLKEIGDKEIHGILYKYLEVWLTAGQGDMKKAFALFDEMPEDLQNLSFTQYHKGLLYELSGDEKASIKQYEKAIESGGDRYRMYEALACGYIRQGNQDKAKETYRKYKELYNNFIIPDEITCDVGLITDAKQGVSESMMYAVLFFTYHRMTEHAYFYLQLAENLTPESSFLKFVIGDFLTHYGNYNDAIRVYEKVPPTSPLYLRIQVSMAGIYEVIGEKDIAKKMLFEMAYKHNTYEFWELLAGIPLREKKFEEAIEYYTKAISLIKEPKEEHWNLFFSRGNSYERLKNWDKAEADFLKVLEIKKDEPYTLNYLAYSWIEQGKNLEQSKEMLEKALEQQPNSPYIMDSYAWALFYLGDYEGALSYMEKAVEIMPYNSTLNEHLGDIYWRLGRKREAKFQWKRAIYYASEDNDEFDEKAIQNKLLKGLPPLDENHKIKPTIKAEK